MSKPPDKVATKPSAATAAKVAAAAAKKAPAGGAKQPAGAAKPCQAASSESKSPPAGRPDAVEAPAIVEHREASTGPGNGSEASRWAPGPGTAGEAVERLVVGDAAIAHRQLTQRTSSRAPVGHTRRSTGQPPTIDRCVVSSARRAELATAAATIAARGAQKPPSTATSVGGTRVRLVALAVVVLLAGAVLAVFLSRSPATALSRADERFMSGQLLAADGRVRSQLVTLRPQDVSQARTRTRGAVATTRSLAVEIRAKNGEAAEGLLRALQAERDWLDAVGSTLANPRSPLREQIVRRDRQLLAALAELPGDGVARRDASQRLVDYARSREGANAAADAG